MATDYYNSVLREMIGVINGINKTFTTLTRYVPGTLRLFWNGQSYEADDSRKGWTEIDDQTIETIKAPRPNDELQAFYQDADSQHLGFDSVIGTPFDPNGVLP